ncbi:MAG: PAS domain S-box protein [Thermoanaerobaculia bacterium]
MAREEGAASTSAYEIRLRSLLQNIAAIVWTVDETLQPVLMAGDAELITGYSQDEIYAEGSPAVWARAVHPDDLRRVMMTHANIFITGEAFDVEYRYRRKDGTWVWLNDRASHVYTLDGKRYIDGITYDVSQRKIEEQQQVAAANFGRRAVQAGDIYALLADACWTTHTALRADSCTALWREADSDDFTFAAMTGNPVPLPTRVADDASILAGYAYRSDRGVTYDDLATEPRFSAPALLANGIRSGISAPLRGRAVRYGVLSVHFLQTRRFTQRECAFVETIANVAADAIDRIQTERALASVADRYAHVVESADQGICALDRGRIVFANSAFARMIAIPIETLLGREFSTLAAPRERTRLEQFVEMPPSDEPAKIEVELAPASGAPLWAIVTRSRPTAGETLVLITDISDRVRVEHDLRRRQAQLGDAQSLAHIGSFEVDLATGLIEWSDEMYRIVGLEPRSRAIDIHFVRSRIPEERSATYAAAMAALSDGGTLDTVHPFLRLDGTVRTVHTRARGTSDVDSGRKRIIGIMQDITAEIDAERAIAEREARLQFLVSRLPVILWSTNAELKITSIIGAGFTAVEDQQLEDLNLTVHDLTGAPPAGISIHDALENRTVSYDVWNGSRELRVHIEPLRDAAGATIGTVGIAFDRTEQFRTERVLSNIAYGAISQIADNFFNSAVLGLASVLNVQFAFIAKVENGALTTVAVARDGEIASNFSHSIAGTPCEPVLRGTPYWIEEHVRVACPNDALLAELDAMSYAGFPIIGANGSSVGLVAVISREPLQRSAAAEAALQIYAQRAGVELDRISYERSLVDEKEYVENLIDTANVVIIEVDEAGHIRLVNRAFEQLTGLTRKDVEGRPLLEMIHDAGPIDQIITTGPHEMEASLDARDGELRLLRFRANDVRRAGRAVGTILFGIDITDARRAEQRQRRMQEQLAHAAEEWRHTFDSVLTPIILLDEEHRIARMNRAAKELTQRDYSELLGERIDAIDRAEPFLTASALLDARDANDSGAETVEVRDGNDRTWAVNLMPIASPEQTPSWSIVVLYDITRIVALQESVRVSEQMSAMGHLVAGVAHEVRNPLFGISAALDAFQEEFGHTGDFGEYLDRLRTDTERLNRLMNELLEYGRPAELQIASQSVLDAIGQSIRVCTPLARQKNVELEVRPKDVATNAMIDRDRIVQVFQNVIENAIAFAPASSRIVVETSEDRDAKQLVITIADHGPGFRADDLPHIFTPFFTRRRGGTGLGLPIVQRIVGDHGGSVTARNGEHGGGVVEIRLPIEERADDA